jgi:hypothetical protein
MYVWMRRLITAPAVTIKVLYNPSQWGGVGSYHRLCSCWRVGLLSCGLWRNTENGLGILQFLLGYEILSRMMEIQIFWDVTHCRLVDYQRHRSSWTVYFLNFSCFSCAYSVGRRWNFYDPMNSPPHLYSTGQMIRHNGNILKLNAHNCDYTDGFIRACFIFYFCVNGNNGDRSRCFLISILGSLVLYVLYYWVTRVPTLLTNRVHNFVTRSWCVCWRIIAVFLTWLRLIIHWNRLHSRDKDDFTA